MTAEPKRTANTTEDVVALEGWRTQRIDPATLTSEQAERRDA